MIKEQLKIEKVIQETPDTKTIRLKVKKPIDFIPGQFMMLGLDLHIDGGKKLVKRAYSIASSPTKKDYLEFTFNIYPKGQLSPHLYALKEGDNLYVEGSFGKFNFKEDNSRSATFIGAGAGLTPLMSMIRYIVDKKLPINCTLVYSVKKPENIIYYKELLDLEKSKKLDLNITITRAEGTDWKGKTGRIDSNMVNELLSPTLKQSNFYLCGPPEMVEGTVKILEDLGVEKDRINREQW